MGNNQTSLNSQKQSDEQNMNNFLKKFKIYTDLKTSNVKNISNGYQMNIFQSTQPQANQSTHKHKHLIALNCHKIKKPKFPSNDQIEPLKKHIDYYQRRKFITSKDNNNLDDSIKSSIIRLDYFQIVNSVSQRKIYPNKNISNHKSGSSSGQQSKQKSISSLATCNFQTIFSKGSNIPSPSITPFKLQSYSFHFLQEFNLNTLQKQIKFRVQNDQYFQEQQIWSLIYCCCQAAKTMIQNGLKQPMLSPSAIYINQDSQIKVGQWEFVNYQSNCNNQEDNFYYSKQSTFQEGQILLSFDMESTLKSNQSKQVNKNDILVKYYWPPEGIIQIQNTLKLGQLLSQNQKLSEAKNSQVFCLGMSILHMLTLKSNYQRQTFSQKQLKRMIQNSINLRNSINVPMSAQIIQILFKMLEWQPSERLTYEDILDFISKIFTNESENQSEQFIVSSRKILKAGSNSQAQYFSFKQKPKESTSITTQLSECFDSKNLFKKLEIQYKRNNNSIGNNTKNTQNYEDQQNDSNLIGFQKDDMQGSGVICQGLGDEYDPQIQDIQNQENVEQYFYKRQQKYESRYAPVYRQQQLDNDKQDQNNLLNQEILPDEQHENPDQDIDFDQIAEKQYIVVHYNQNSSRHQQYGSEQHQPLYESFQNPFNSNKQQQQYMTKSFSRLANSQHIPASYQTNQFFHQKGTNYANSKFYPTTHYQINKFSIQNLYTGGDDMNPFQTSSYYQVQNVRDQELSGQYTDIKKQVNDLKRNLLINDLSFQNSGGKQTMNQLRFSDKGTKYNEYPNIMIRQTSSPILIKQLQKQNYSSIDKNQSLFTDPHIMAMVKSFTQKTNLVNHQQKNYLSHNDQQQNYNNTYLSYDNNNNDNENNYRQYNEQQYAQQQNHQEETPNFQSVRLREKKSSMNEGKGKQTVLYNVNSKKLFEEPFDRCFDNENKQENINQGQIQRKKRYQDQQKAAFKQDQIFKQQFSKGLYQGAKQNGARNGFGTFYYKQGGKYQGYWYNNKMEGHGTLYYPDGRIAYQGQWKNDALHGKGVLHNQKPNKIYGYYDFRSFDQCETEQSWIYYDGWFQNDQKYGFGELLLSNGEKYVGQFKNDMIHGKGKFYRNDGTIIQTEWQNNQLSE